MRQIAFPRAADNSTCWLNYTLKTHSCVCGTGTLLVLAKLWKAPLPLLAPWDIGAFGMQPPSTAGRSQRRRPAHTKGPGQLEEGSLRAERLRRRKMDWPAGLLAMHLIRGTSGQQNQLRGLLASLLHHIPTATRAASTNQQLKQTMPAHCHTIQESGSPTWAHRISSAAFLLWTLGRIHFLTFPSSGCMPLLHLQGCISLAAFLCSLF
jgi:hypothetical protein